jgi:hypothetical protein
LYLVLAPAPSSDSVTILEGSQPGAVATVNATLLPRSFNQPEGATFSYSMWILVNDFTTGFGQRRTIFNQGDAPGVYLDSTSNSLLINMKTFGMTESVLVPNIPAAKWIHLAIVVNQEAMDIYINGTLRQHHTLSQLVNQPEEENVEMGPGWDGVIGRVVYYRRSLSYAEVRKLSMEQPPPDLQVKPATPNYFDITWYIGRLNST